MVRIKFLLVILLDYTSCNSYTFVPGSFTFQKGRDECLKRSSDLAIITDIDMHKEVINLLAPEIGGGLERVWIGLEWHKPPTSHFSWVNNTVLGSFTNWKSGEPNCMEESNAGCFSTLSYDQNCVRLQYVSTTSWVWMTHGCYNQYAIICQTLSSSIITDAQTTTVSSTTDAQTTTVASTTDEQTTTVSSTTDAQTTTVSSTTDAQTTTVARTTDAQTTTVSSTTDAQTTTVSSTTDAQTRTVASTTDAQTTTVAITTDAQTTTVASTTDAQTSIVSTTTNALTTTVAGTTDAQTTTVSSTTDAQTTTVAGTTDAQTTTVAGTTDAQATTVASTPDTTVMETTSESTKKQLFTSFTYSVSDSAATTVSSKTNPTTSPEPQVLPMITTTEQETSLKPNTYYIPVEFTMLGTFFVNSTQICSCHLLSNQTNSPGKKWNFKIDKRSTNAYIRQHTSAYDGRLSSRIIGYTGIFVIGGVLLFVLFADLTTFLDKKKK